MNAVLDWWSTTDVSQSPVNGQTKSTPAWLYATDRQQQNSNQQQQQQTLHQPSSKC